MKIFIPETTAELQAAIGAATTGLLDNLFLASENPRPEQLDELSRSLVGLGRLVDTLSTNLKRNQ